MRTPDPADSGSKLRRRLRSLLGILTLVVVTVGGAVYLVDPWWAGPAPLSSPPRPLGKPVSVEGETVSILAAGDILLHPELWDQARRDGGGTMDFGPILAGVGPAIEQTDLALCHLETPLAPPGGPYIGFPLFSVPQEIVKGIKEVGFDGCSTASNHSLDHGVEGINRTLDVLDEVGVGHTGTYRTADEAKRPKIYEVGDVRVAHLSYTKSFNGLRRPENKDWVANLIDVEKVEADAAASRSAGADIVVVSLHWGTEYQHEPDVDQQQWARQIAAMRDVDVVFGHHAHVVQPIEQFGEKWVVYGLGNQIARHDKPTNGNRDGAMIRVTFGPAGGTGRWKVAAIEAIPTFVDLNPDIRLVDLERALAEPGLSPGRRRIYEAAVERIRGHLSTRVQDQSALTVRGVAAD
ncbi:CapA family protein [Polymorphospora rubra]|uniref:Poly-gamma-glutamate biosynthesis protein n=1 Tax=Polymorphospora rubra TaxID=338584 RepID=A0A810MWK6_9ACTN|nr:CapA family protein [Polymorphospora rubra]BCJ64904.1 poly-gamma-glutamate biosynthesis protein [Polymorphospora rubra]